MTIGLSTSLRVQHNIVRNHFIEFFCQLCLVLSQVSEPFTFSKRGSIADPFCLLVEPFTYYWVASSYLDMWVYAQSFCTLLCHVQLISLGGLLSSEGKKSTGSQGRRGMVGMGRGGWKEDCSQPKRGWRAVVSQDVLYQRRIKEKSQRHHSDSVLFFFNSYNIIGKANVSERVSVLQTNFGSLNPTFKNLLVFGVKPKRGAMNSYKLCSQQCP